MGISAAPPKGIVVDGVKNASGSPEYSKKRILRMKVAAANPENVGMKIALPSKISLRSKMPPIYRQYYGSCTSNAVLAVDHFLFHKKNKEWRPSCTFTFYNQHVDLTGEPSDDGSSIYQALKMCKKYGACDAKFWPNESPWDKKPSKAAYADGVKGKEITKWRELTNLTSVKQVLAKGMPVPITLTWVYKEAMEGTDKFILKTPTKKEVAKCMEGHAVVAIGYDDKLKLVEIRNSWGETWGDHGHFYITYEAMNLTCWYEDSYEILNKPA